MSLAIKLNGDIYEFFESGSISSSIGSVLTPFKFVSSANMENSFPIKQNDQISVIADGAEIANGRVENIAGSYKQDEHLFTISGRGALADFVDSTVGDIKEFSGNNLVSICTEVLKGIGLSSIKVINNAGDIKSFDKSELTSADVGMTCFEFCESFARKRQVLLTTDGFNLVLARAGTKRAGIDLQHIVGAKDNNILSASVSLSIAERFNKYIVRSQLNTNGLITGITPQISNQVGTAIDSEIPQTRILEMNAEESSNSGTATDRAKWEANIRRAKSLNYSASVQGHSFGGGVIENNTLIKVVDDYFDLSATLLVVGVKLDFDLKSGSITSAKMTYEDAFSLQVEKDSRGINKTSDGLIDSISF